MTGRIFGAGLILAALAFGALVYLNTRRQRIELMAQLSAALDTAAGELSLRSLPLPRLFELLEKRSGGAAAEFFGALCTGMDRLSEEDFSTLWESAAEEHLGLLHSTEREEIDRLGAVLGRYELQRQLAAVRDCRAAMDRALSSARQDYPTQRRLALGLSATTGALLIIILV